MTFRLLQSNIADSYLSTNTNTNERDLETNFKVEWRHPPIGGLDFTFRRKKIWINKTKYTMDPGIYY